MHGPLEPPTDEKPALQPNAAIGPALRAVAGNILAKARVALTDPERSNQDAVHDFRRAMKQWRALMRLLEPFIPDADRWRREARDHARSLAHARDGAAALNAFDGLGDKGILLLSERSKTTVRTRIEALRGNEEQAVLTPALRDTILAWLDAATAAIELWPLDPFDFSAIAAQLADSYRSARHRTPADWEVRRGHILQGMQEAMGKLPPDSEKVPLDVKVLTEEAFPFHVRKKISFATEKEDRVSAWLFVPTGGKGKLPAVLCLHQTVAIGKDEAKKIIDLF